ncbi:hypothetical protein GH714_031819 [Hevea brasiliensis]|uniref:Saccharopine dehydrogenase NADP binding domain-containing protein n=1 Tax=Hevea brasiliensis TaxID=3981 RepID=A0A6A6LH21_HEVBR|nr:hypothetical protein GH714_031819 [Hevea brasiliensis]
MGVIPCGARGRYVLMVGNNGGNIIFSQTGLPGEPESNWAAAGANEALQANTLSEKPSSSSIPSSPLKSLALAGRKPTKITHALNWASHHNTPPPIPILKADTTIRSSIRHLCTQTKLILNCVGPFYLYGEPVVAACAQTGYIWEPEFMERMEMKFHENAVETGSLVVSACGFDSVPAELGWMFNSRQWVSPAVPHQIEAYLSMESEKRIVLNFGTYESAILGVSTMEELQDLRLSRPKRARPAVS